MNKYFHIYVVYYAIIIGVIASTISMIRVEHRSQPFQMNCQVKKMNESF